MGTWAIFKVIGLGENTYSAGREEKVPRTEPWNTSDVILHLSISLSQQLYYHLIQVTYHITLPFKIHKSMFSSTVTELYSHHHNQILEYFVSPKSNTVPISSHYSVLLCMHLYLCCFTLFFSAKKSLFIHCASSGRKESRRERRVNMR